MLWCFGYPIGRFLWVPFCLIAFARNQTACGTFWKSSAGKNLRKKGKKVPHNSYSFSALVLQSSAHKCRTFFFNKKNGHKDLPLKSAILVPGSSNRRRSKGLTETFRLAPVTAPEDQYVEFYRPIFSHFILNIFREMWGSSLAINLK